MPATATLAPVLDYAQARPSPVKRLLRAAILIALVLLAAGAGALVGRALAPVTWTNMGAYQLRTPIISLTSWDEEMTAYDREVAAHARTLLTPESLEAIAADVAARGHAVPPPAQMDWLTRGLRAQPLKDSELVVISFSSRDPSLARDVVAAAVRLAITQPAGELNLRVINGGNGPVPTRSPAAPGGGAIAGAAVASIALQLVQRRRTRAR